jgi:diamine N-acetyltransferase
MVHTVIRLSPITPKNWYECTQLNVTKEQKSIFPVPVVYWLTEASYKKHLIPLAVQLKGKVIGFVVYSALPENEINYWIMAFMIDAKYQRKHYGTEAMQKLLQLLFEIHGFRKVRLGHRPENIMANRFYERLGFKKFSNELIDGEIIMEITEGEE